MLIRDQIVEVLRADPSLRPLWDEGRRPRVGVSACLLGEPVRYDGTSKRTNILVSMLPLCVEVVSLCPEVAIGLGVPRPTIQRVRLVDGSEVVRGIADRSLDVTARLDAYAAEIAAGKALHGYVFKARSPSCGPGNAPLFDEDDKQIGVAPGRYAEGLRAAFPDAPMADEDALRTAGQVADFIVACYRQAARAPRPGAA